MAEIGRPTSITPEVVNKLITAFANGLNVSQACIYAEISRPTYYKHLEEDTNFSNRMEEAQNRIGIKAREVVAVAVSEGDVGAAKWWLERRDPDFKAKAELAFDPADQKKEERYKAFLDDGDDDREQSVHNDSSEANA